MNPKLLHRKSMITAKARELFETHSLDGWKITFMSFDYAAGKTSSMMKTISFSLEYIMQASIPNILDVILHEVAHAIVGSENNHSNIWEEKFRELGGSGNIIAEV